jgi:hypothetical protein
MRNKAEAKYMQSDIDYITNIKVKADNKLIYNVNISPSLSENPLFKFSYQDIKPNSLTLEYTDHNGSIKKYNRRVRERKSKRKIHKPIKLSTNAKSYPTKIKSIQKIFGNITLIEDGIQLIAPKQVENGKSIPIRIRSDIKFKSIALFMKNKYENSWRTYSSKYKDGEFYLISQWFSTPYSIAEFFLRIKMKEGVATIVLVLEAKNGKFYTIKPQRFQWSVGGMGG